MKIRQTPKLMAGKYTAKIFGCQTSIFAIEQRKDGDLAWSHIAMREQQDDFFRFEIHRFSFTERSISIEPHKKKPLEDFLIFFWEHLAYVAFKIRNKDDATEDEIYPYAQSKYEIKEEFKNFLSLPLMIIKTNEMESKKASKEKDGHKAARKLASVNETEHIIFCKTLAYCATKFYERSTVVITIKE